MYYTYFTTSCDMCQLLSGFIDNNSCMKYDKYTHVSGICFMLVSQNSSTRKQYKQSIHYKAL